MTTKEHVLRLSDVKRQTGLARSTIYALIQEDAFPKQIKLSKRAVGWRATDIERWIQSRIA